jgi:hypothetical protein
MATTDLKLDEPGSLSKPGPVGRIVRMLFGLLCLWYVSELLTAFERLVASDGHIPALLAVAALASYLLSGTAETELFARAVWVWEVYLFAHLGLSFVLAAVIGTPGCEMRAFHDLYSRITGNPTKEHYCPVGPLHPIDQWEARRSR